MRGLHTGDHPDHNPSAAAGIIVIREQQVMTGTTEKLLSRGRLGRLVEELAPASTAAASTTRSIRTIAP